MEKMEKESLTAQSSPENPAENTPEKPELNERVGIAEAILFVTGNAIEKREMCSAMNLTEQEDQYINTTVTRARKADTSGGGRGGFGGGGSGGSGVHMGGGGVSHGGGGRGF